jgi:hypothetical protein
MRRLERLKQLAKLKIILNMQELELTEDLEMRMMYNKRRKRKLSHSNFRDQLNNMLRFQAEKLKS